MFRPTDFLLLALFLFPVAVYCSALGMVNRRSRPLMVAGAWDFLWVLLAAGGFLLFVGPAVISGAFGKWLKELPMQRETMSLADSIAEIWALWWVVWVLYYLFVLGGGGFLVWLRRNVTVIYNVDAATLDKAFGAAAQKLGLAMSRRGNGLYFTADAGGDKQLGIYDAELSSPPVIYSARPAQPSAVVDVSYFPLLNNVTLTWDHSAPAARADLERELRSALAETYVSENAAAGWLLGISALLFVFIIGLTGVFITIMTMKTWR